MVSESGGLAWIRLKNGDIQPGPCCNLPVEYKSPASRLKRWEAGRVSLEEITDSSIRAAIIEVRSAMQRIFDRVVFIESQGASNNF